jgi:hypothetical protein
VNNIILGVDQESRISVKTLQKFLQFFTKSIVQHLPLYQSVFESDQEEAIQSTLLSIQTPMVFPSLMSHLQPAEASPRYEDEGEFDEEEGEV